MKCIYCNAEKELTSSDIITSAITGAKLTKSFVCHEHNAFTNDKYEKRFSADLAFFRNHLGLFTRDGKDIQYKADLLAEGTKINNVKISNRKSLYKPKNVIVGTSSEGDKLLLVPKDKEEKFDKTNKTWKRFTVDLSDVIIHKSFSPDVFLGFYAVHSIAKIAYEWYCYINNIEEFNENYHEIVDYILGEIDNDIVEIVSAPIFYEAMDQLSEPGTNSCFQYDDIDGYRYVIFNLWNVIAYKVKICISQKAIPLKTEFLRLKLYMYHIDGTKDDAYFGLISLNGNIKPTFSATLPQNMTNEAWEAFVKRIENIMSTIVMSLNTLKREVDSIASELKKYDEGKIDFGQLLDFGGNNITATIDIIDKLYANKDKYDTSKSFSQNMQIILQSDKNNVKTVAMEEKESFIANWVEMDKNKTLSDYLWKRINTFNDIYKSEIN